MSVLCNSPSSTATSDRKHRGLRSAVPAAMGELLCGAASCLLFAALVVLPWFNGGARPVYQYWLLCGVLLCLLLAAPSVLLRRTSMSLPAICLPLAGGLLLGCLQLVPLPHWFHEMHSPVRAQWQATLLDWDMAAGTGASAQPLRQAYPVSIEPAATRELLTNLVLALSCVLLGCWLFGTRGRLTLLMAMIAGSGVAVAIVGLSQRSVYAVERGWQELYGSADIEGFAGLANRNHAAGYLLICFAAAIGLASSIVAKGNERENRDFAKQPATANAVRWLLAMLDSKCVLASTAAVLIGAGVAATLSRGGLVSLACSLLVLPLMLGGRRSLLGLGLVAVVAVAAWWLLAWMGVGPGVVARISQSADWQAVASEGRLVLWQAGVDCGADNLWLGTGLGTWANAHLPYLQQPTWGWARNPENQFVQALVEGGVAGLALIAWLIVAFAVCLRRMLLAGDCWLRGMALAGGFLLVSQVVSNSFAFGLHLPANIAATGLVAGAIAAAQIGQQFQQEPSASPNAMKWRLHALAMSAALITALLSTVLATRELSVIAAIDAAIEPIREPWSGRTLPLDNPRPAIAVLERLVRERPDDGEAHLRLAELWMRRYQLQAETQLRSASALQLDEQAVRKLSSREHLHEIACTYHLVAATDELAALRAHPAVQQNLTPAWRHLQAARAASPLRGRVHLHLGELAPLFDEHDPLSPRHLRVVSRLARSQTRTQARVAGLLIHLSVRRIPDESKW